MNNVDAWKKILNVIEQNVFHGELDMVGNNQLVMFYVTKFLQECVYFHQETDTFVIAEIENENVFVHNIFSSTLEDIDTVIPLFGKGVKNITFGFTPMESEKYNVTEIQEGDITFFIKGDFLDIVCKKKMRIPSLAHA